MLALFDLNELGAEHAHAGLAVLELVTLRLAGDDDAGRLVDQAHGGACLVDVLAARAGGAVDLHLDVLGPDLDVLGVIGDLGDDLDRGKRGLPPGVGVERRHAHEAVNAVFALEQAVGVLALDEDAGGFDARLVAVEVVEDLVAQAVLLSPVGVHAVEHGGPVLRLGAARARLEGDDGVVVVILAGQKRLEPGLFHLLLELGIALGQLGEHGVVAFLDGHLTQRVKIVPLAAHSLIQLDLGLELAALLHDLL